MFVANGLDGATGDYLLPEVPLADLSQVAQGERLGPEELVELKWKVLQDEAHYGPAQGIDPTCLDETGWGLIADPELDPEILEALRPLRDLRRKQATAGGHEDFYQEFLEDRGYRKGESKQDFLVRNGGASAGPPNPKKGVPYYLLIIGPPDIIPFSFQYQLDVAYAVGRVCFDKPSDYRVYAEAVVAAEKAAAGSAPPRISLFGPSNTDDKATGLSTKQLVLPLAAQLSEQNSQWAVETAVGANATKARLLELLTEGESPDVVFTASHGVAFPSGSDEQRSDNGALVCQEWPGPKAWKKALPGEFYLSGSDIDAASSVHGSVVFSFACFGAGTPQMDDFTRRAFEEPAAIAEEPFVARLPQRLLAHPHGSVLAFVGHVDRAWGCSFTWKGQQQLEVFRSTMADLLDGCPVGAAMEWFNQKYAELSADLTSELDNIRNFGRIPDDFELASMWTSNNDARNYTIVGDPAVRIRSRED